MYTVIIGTYVRLPTTTTTMHPSITGPRDAVTATIVEKIARENSYDVHNIAVSYYCTTMDLFLFSLSSRQRYDACYIMRSLKPYKG